MRASVASLLMNAWNGVVYTLRWITALFRVACRYWWRVKVAFFNSSTQGNLDEFMQVYGNYHRAICFLLLGDIDAALEDPPPPLPDRWQL